MTRTKNAEMNIEYVKSEYCPGLFFREIWYFTKYMFYIIVALYQDHRRMR